MAEPLEVPAEMARHAKLRARDLYNAANSLRQAAADVESGTTFDLCGGMQRAQYAVRLIRSEIRKRARTGD